MVALDHLPSEADFQLLQNDPYTFSVLRRIMKGACVLILTDHRRFMLCHSAARYPVWIWTPDGAKDADKERAWQIAWEARPLTQGFQYNLKYELAEYFIARAKRLSIQAAIVMHLLTYDCPSPVAPTHPADGGLYACTEKDTDEAARMIAQFHAAITDGPANDTYCRGRAAEYIASGAFFFWKNAQGAAVACCSYKPDEGLAALGSVFTLPQYRRMHYAQNMVYAVTRHVADLGYTPILYTDGDYAPSNACYQKIGYTLKGRLCTLAAVADRSV